MSGAPSFGLVGCSNVRLEKARVPGGKCLQGETVVVAMRIWWVEEGSNGIKRIRLPDVSPQATPNGELNQTFAATTKSYSA